MGGPLLPAGDGSSWPFVPPAPGEPTCTTVHGEPAAGTYRGGHSRTRGSGVINALLDQAFPFLRVEALEYGESMFSDFLVMPGSTF